MSLGKSYEPPIKADERPQAKNPLFLSALICVHRRLIMSSLQALSELIAIAPVRSYVFNNSYN
jgi:hypothetical protein